MKKINSPRLLGILTIILGILFISCGQTAGAGNENDKPNNNPNDNSGESSETITSIGKKDTDSSSENTYKYTDADGNTFTFTELSDPQDVSLNNFRLAREGSENTPEDSDLPTTDDDTISNDTFENPDTIPEDDIASDDSSENSDDIPPTDIAPDTSETDEKSGIWTYTKKDATVPFYSGTYTGNASGTVPSNLKLTIKEKEGIPAKNPVSFDFGITTSETEVSFSTENMPASIKVATIKKIKVTTSKTEYQVGDNLDETSIVISATYDDDDETEKTVSFDPATIKIEGFDSTKAIEEQNVKFTYTVNGNDISDEITIKISSNGEDKPEEKPGETPVEPTEQEIEAEAIKVIESYKFYWAKNALWQYNTQTIYIADRSKLVKQVGNQIVDIDDSEFTEGSYVTLKFNQGKTYKNEHVTYYYDSEGREYDTWLTDTIFKGQAVTDKIYGEYMKLGDKYPASELNTRNKEFQEKYCVRKEYQKLILPTYTATLFTKNGDSYTETVLSENVTIDKIGSIGVIATLHVADHYGTGDIESVLLATEFGTKQKMSSKTYEWAWGYANTEEAFVTSHYPSPKQIADILPSLFDKSMSIEFSKEEVTQGDYIDININFKNYWGLNPDSVDLYYFKDKEGSTEKEKTKICTTNVKDSKINIKTSNFPAGEYDFAIVTEDGIESSKAHLKINEYDTGVLYYHVSGVLNRYFAEKDSATISPTTNTLYSSIWNNSKFKAPYMKVVQNAETVKSGTFFGETEGEKDIPSYKVTAYGFESSDTPKTETISKQMVIVGICEYGFLGIKTNTYNPNDKYVGMLFFYNKKGWEASENGTKNIENVKFTSVYPSAEENEIGMANNIQVSCESKTGLSKNAAIKFSIDVTTFNDEEPSEYDLYIDDNFYGKITTPVFSTSNLEAGKHTLYVMDGLLKSNEAEFEIDYLLEFEEYRYENVRTCDVDYDETWEKYNHIWVGPKPGTPSFKDHTWTEGSYISFAKTETELKKNVNCDSTDIIKLPDDRSLPTFQVSFYEKQEDGSFAGPFDCGLCIFASKPNSEGFAIILLREKNGKYVTSSEWFIFTHNELKKVMEADYKIEYTPGKDDRYPSYDRIIKEYWSFYDSYKAQKAE